MMVTNEGLFPDRQWMCMRMKAGLDNKGQWLAWGIDKIYEEINNGIPVRVDRSVPSYISGLEARVWEAPLTKWQVTMLDAIPDAVHRSPCRSATTHSTHLSMAVSRIVSQPSPCFATRGPSNKMGSSSTLNFCLVGEVTGVPCEGVLDPMPGSAPTTPLSALPRLRLESELGMTTGRR